MIQKLKESVELKFGQKITYQKDCKDLSDRVLSTTSRLISPSTLRRFYGFLATNSNPSRATLDILSSYCGFKNWDDFKKNKSNSTTGDSQPALEAWASATENAEQITQKHLDIQKKRIAFDFQSAISREFLAERMRLYIDSQYTAMPIVAPSGSGKTVAIAKWIEDYNKNNSDSPTIILYLSSAMLEAWLSKDLGFEEWLLQILNVKNANFFKSLESSNGFSIGKIFLFVDGFDELTNKKPKFDKIIRAIEHATLNFSGSWFKLILSCCNNTWNQIGNQLSSADSWYYSSYENFTPEGSNIPKLNRNEIQEVLDSTINLELKQRLLAQEVDNSTLRIICHPSYLNVFIHLLGKEPRIVNIFKTEILSEILKRDVVQSQYPDECLDILYKLAEISEKEKSYNSVKKNDLKEAYPIHLKLAGKYFSAYEYLLSSGLVVEYLSEGQLGIPTKVVKISSDDMYAYISLIKLIEKHGQIDFKLFQTIENSFSGCNLLPEIVVMLYGMAYKNKEVEVLGQFFSLKESTLAHVFKQSTIQKILATDAALANELISLYLSNPKARKYLVEINADLNIIICYTKKLIVEYQGYFDSDIEYLIGKTLEFTSKTFDLDFSWINEFNTKFTISTPPISASPKIAGLWFQCKILADYFSTGSVDKQIENNIRVFENQNSASWDKNDYNEFTLSIVFGYLLAKRYDLGFKQIDSIFKPSLNIPTTPDDNALKLYLEYTRWRNTFHFDPTTMKLIEKCLLDLPEWISHQTYILGTSWFAMFCLMQGNLEKAHYLYQNAIEMSNVCGYKILEMKLLKNLSQVLISLGENDRAAECDELVKSLSAQSNVDFNLL